MLVKLLSVTGKNQITPSVLLMNQSAIHFSLSLVQLFLSEEIFSDQVLTSLHGKCYAIISSLFMDLNILSPLLYSKHVTINFDRLYASLHNAMFS